MIAGGGYEQIVGGEAPPAETATAEERIFVGGLGAAVTAEDLRSTFGTVGRIDSVELIRTKGRSFAYLDFVPSSEKSMPKLFSTYNGCMWKGGRLKLEKAKEHYILRLKRERSEDAELVSSAVNDTVDATESLDSLRKLNKVMNPKTSEIRLFFPKLRKLRPLPFNGTGKHKYSFQRIEGPTLPVHFCDCEEHSMPLYPARENKLFVRETQDGGIDEKELKIMESVMNKLLEKEDKSKVGSARLGLVKEREKTPEPLDDLAVDDEADDIIDEDDDNLVMNMVAMDNVRNGSLKNWRQETDVDNERALANSLRVSKDRPLNNEPMSQRIKISPSEKKRKSSNAEPANDKVAYINIEGKRSSKKIRSHDLTRETEKVSATRKTNINISLLKTDEKFLKPAISQPVSVDDGEAATEPLGEIAVDDNEEDDLTEEDDNLVLNMVSGGNIRRESTEGWREEPILDIEGAVMDGIQISKFEPSGSMLKRKSSKILASEKKKKPPHTEATDGKVVSIDTDGKRSPGKVRKNDSTLTTEILSTIEKSNTDVSFSKQKDAADEKITMESSITTIEESDSKNENKNQNLLQNVRNSKSESNPSKKPSEAAILLEKPNASTDKQPKKGALWAQKSSWTNLVGGTNASFSISQLLPGKKFKKEEQPEQPKNFFAAKVTIHEPSEVVVKSSSGLSSSDGGYKASSGVLKEKAPIPPIRYSIGETCSFMRSDASMKEWKSTKAALNESLKK